MSKKKKGGFNIGLTSYDELVSGGKEGKDGKVNIPVDQIHPFKDHPFKVIENDEMEELKVSIKETGVITPVIVRKISNNNYEMISGHRRLHAAKACGLKDVPAIVVEATDEEAVIMMVDTNIQREEILPSERAFAFKMRREAVKNQKEGDGRVRDEIGEQVGLSGRQIDRYIKLTNLIPDVLTKVDTKEIGMTVACEISDLGKTYQSWVNEFLDAGNKLTGPRVKAFADMLSKAPDMDKDEAMAFLEGTKKKPVRRKLSFSTKSLKEYFPETYTADQMEEVILLLLDEWKDQNNK